MVVAWAIPDVPRKLSDRLKREEYLTREIIIDHELQRAATARDKEQEQEQSPNLTTKQFENVFRLRKANGDNTASSELWWQLILCLMVTQWMDIGQLRE